MILAIAATLLSPHASAQVVDIPDPNLEAVLRETLELPPEAPITQQEMLRLEQLDASGNRGITDITGLEYATTLTSLSLWGNPIFDIPPLQKLTQLEFLDLSGCRVSDISPLTNLTQLKRLNLSWNLVEDISPRANLIHLERLQLYGRLEPS